MKRYPKVRYPGEEETYGVFLEGEVYIQEKLDGGNGRFMLEEHLNNTYVHDDREFVFGSRNLVYKNAKDEPNQFEGHIKYARERLNSDIVRDYENEMGKLIFFGEYMKPHTIQGYDWENIPKFIGFDVWQADMDRFLHPERAKDIFETLGLDYAPIIDICKAENWDGGDTKFHNDEGEIEVPQSEYGDIRAEGFMFKNPTTQIYAKLVREDFKEKNNKIFNSTSYEPSGAERLSHEYITNARIEKKIHKLANEEWGYNMEMMQKLPIKVIEDMAEEEAKNIFVQERYDVNLKDFRSQVSSRCSNLLRRIINERIQKEV